MAAVDRAPSTPSNGPEGKPRVASRNCSIDASQPTAGARRTREPNGGRPRRPSAWRVTGPLTPSTAMPARDWTARTPLAVPGPARPSTGPE